MTQNELPYMPAKTSLRIALEERISLKEQMTTLRGKIAEKEDEIIEILREKKKGSISFEDNGIRYTVAIKNLDSKLEISREKVK